MWVHALLPILSCPHTQARCETLSKGRSGQFWRKGLGGHSKDICSPPGLSPTTPLAPFQAPRVLHLSKVSSDFGQLPATWACMSRSRDCPLAHPHPVQAVRSFSFLILGPMATGRKGVLMAVYAEPQAPRPTPPPTKMAGWRLGPHGWKRPQEKLGQG